MKKRIVTIASGFTFTLVVILGWWYCYSLPRNFGVVTPGVLYRCGEGKVFQYHNAAQKYGIRTIFCLREVRGLDAERRMAEQNQINFVFHPIDTHKPVPEEYWMEFLKMTQDPQRTPLLVHCAMGCHRTGFFCAIYRMVIDGWPREKALKEMESYGFDLNSHTELVKGLRQLDPVKIREKLKIRKNP